MIQDDLKRLSQKNIEILQEVMEIDLLIKNV